MAKPGIGLGGAGEKSRAQKGQGSRNGRETNLTQDKNWEEGEGVRR